MALFAGLMSGTSLDGVDVALVRFEGRAERPAEARLEAYRCVPYDQDVRARLGRAVEGEARTAELCDLDFELGELFSSALLATLEEAGVEPAEVAAIGSHGQTFWHRPPEGDRPGRTLQLGEAAVVAERTGIEVVSDFRVRDVAAGGHGAPISACFDWLVLADPREARGIQNLGGMGNLTALPAAEPVTEVPTEGAARPIAFDTGPGVALLDAAVERLTGGRERFDEDGRLAARGEVLPEALEEWLSDSFFATPPPRTTGRERFGAGRVQDWLRRHEGERAEDLLATLTELTALSVAGSLEWVAFDLDALYLCGGGARNPELRRRIRRAIAPRALHPLERLGWDGDAREAAAFALLARQHLLGLPVRISWATGARGDRILGKRTPA